VNKRNGKLKLGLVLGYSGRHMKLPVELVQLAERLGFDSVWTGESYGSDAVTPLVYLGAFTKRIRLGTGVMQLAARTPANAAMSMATLDAMVGGKRVICGVGVSGPQIVEGWYGQPWGKPYYRLADYVAIMRKIFKREEPVAHEGTEISLPYTGPGAVGLGKPLKSILHMNPDIPIWLGTAMEDSVRLTGRIADGCMPLGFVPETAATFKGWLRAGMEKAGRREEDFELQPTVHVVAGDDVKAGLAKIKPFYALYVGGMGAKEKNFHKELMVRRGYKEAAERIQELYLAQRKEEAVAAVPDDFVDQSSLVGPKARIQKRYRDWQDAGITGLSIWGGEAEVRLMAECAGLDPMPQ